MRQKRTVRASSVWASRWVWLVWALYCSFARGDYDGPFSTLNPRNTHLALEGATTRLVFEVHIEKVLLPSLRRAQVLVMDNLSAHKGERIRELLESAGCELLYLPPYSPDVSLIEEASSKVKGLIRKAEARSREALVEAMGKTLDAVTTRDARSLFEHCGYRASGQLF